MLALAAIPFISKGETWQKIASIGIGVIGVLATIFSTVSVNTTVNAKQVVILQNGEINVNTSVHPIEEYA